MQNSKFFGWCVLSVVGYGIRHIPGVSEFHFIKFRDTHVSKVSI